MIDAEAIRQSVDLLSLAGRDTTLRKSGAWHCGPCPLCGGHDRFVIVRKPDGWRWLCRSCTDGKYLDALAYVARRENLDLHRGEDFRRACELLGAVDSLPERQQRAASPTRPAGPPPAEWQANARRVIAECGATLWADAGSRAREWLYRRGLSADTLRRWRIGYLPGASTEWRNMAGLSVPCGIVIPCEVGGVVWYVKARRAIGHPKYQQIKGGRPALYGAETLRGFEVAVLCEGEFDCVLLWQACGDLAGVATLGSATTRDIDLTAFGAYLLPLAWLLLAYDLDDAGKRGASTLANMTARARRASVPTMPGVKDLTDFHMAGGNLRHWLTFELARHALPPLPADAGN